MSGQTATSPVKLKKSKEPAYDVSEWKSEGFVGTCDRLSQADLRQLINELSGQAKGASALYFLKWAHEVSGLVSQLPDNFPSPQGQLITPQLELRWQQKAGDYNILLLSVAEVNSPYKFEPIAQGLQWETCDRPVLLHDRRVPQYPKAFRYEKILADQLRQRYFRNTRSGVVQFVALSFISHEDLSRSQEAGADE